MGGCFSVITMDATFEPSSPTAKVISTNGSLLEYQVSVAVSLVLKAEEAASSSATGSFFVCNSDSFNYGTYIPALDSDHQLDADQIYFVLPNSMLHRRLTATDMASLAVRASLALQNASRGRKDRTRLRKKTRVSPVLIVKSEPRSYDDFENDFTIGPSNSLMKKKPGKDDLGSSRSGSVRKLQRYTSKRAMKAVRSFKLRLTPIQEGTEVL
ncbi:hypothetical protein M0R45_025674 [Rubus argutus]|uniref:Uncharacterized protein n=1 Tax=Rubus argutus TaxID=59490 RepID=A0AAW1WXM6_RUBAR